MYRAPGRPAEIDVTHAGQAFQDLARAVAPGATMVVADLTATRFCDSADFRQATDDHGARG